MSTATNGSNGVHTEDLVDINIIKTPSDLGAVLPLLKYLNANVSSLLTDNYDARLEFLGAASKLVLALETPRETMVKHCWAHSAVAAALNTGTVSGLWTTMAKNGDRPQAVHELAESTGVDEEMLGRLMRHLAAMHYLTETGPSEYKTTTFTNAMALEVMGSSHIALCAGTSAAPNEFHEFALENKFQNITDPHNTPFQRAYNTDLDVFRHLHSVGYGDHFNNHMRAYAQGRVRWIDPRVYPVQERLIDGAESSPESPFLVDIAGGVGHDLLDFKKTFPDHPGQLILEDLPKVMEQARELDSDIVRVEHDFHDPQPIQGARAYFMHSILHSWPDSVCKSILGSVVKAMKPGYSKLLLNESVVPTTNPHWEMTALDVLMLTLFSAKERTADDWTSLLEANGLKIIKIWQGGRAWESLIECELA